MNPIFGYRFASLDSRAAVLAAMVFALLPGFMGSAAAEELKLGGTGAALGSMRLLANEFSAKHPEIRLKIVPNLGSGGGIQAVLAGAIDLAVTSRPLNAEERQRGAAESEYGRTPFVFAVAAKTAIVAITSQELAEIYAGTRVKWPDGSPIRIVLRSPSDIDTEMVKAISPEIRAGVTAAAERPGVKIALTDQDAANDLERIPGAVGPVALSLVISEKRALRALRLDGIQPTLQNAASQTYPYSKRMFLVTGAKRTATAADFAAFVLSPAGRKILAANGHWLP